MRRWTGPPSCFRTVSVSPPFEMSPTYSRFLVHLWGCLSWCWCWATLAHKATNLPAEFRFFGWLLHHGRWANLLHRNVCKPEDAHCERCFSVLGTDDHIFVRWLYVRPRKKSGIHFASLSTMVCTQTLVAGLWAPITVGSPSRWAPITAGSSDVMFGDY